MNINREIAKGAGWMIALRMFNRTAGFISTLFLARLLVPADFGLVAMATALQQLLIAISDFSVDVPLIQMREIDRSHMDSAWSLQLLLGAIQAAMLLALIHPAELFYQTSKVGEILIVLAFTSLIRGANNIGIVMFQRNMTFHKDFLLMGAKRLVTLCVTLPIAFIWHTYWALLAGIVSAALTSFTLSYIMHPYRPRWDRRRWRSLIRFSRWLLATNVLNSVFHRGPDFVLGRLIGPQAVGLFSIGSEIGRLPLTELVAPINRVALPGYSRLNNASGDLKQGYLDVSGMIALIAVPAAAGLAAGAPLLVPLLLGSNWSSSIPVIHYIALSATIGVLVTNIGTVFNALGKPSITTALTIVRTTALLPGCVLGALYDGVSGVALAYLAIAGVMFFLNFGILLVVLKLRSYELLCAIGRPIVGSAAMYIILTTIVVPSLSNAFPLLPATLITILSGTGIYILSTVGLWLLGGRPVSAETRLFTILRLSINPTWKLFKLFLSSFSS